MSDSVVLKLLGNLYYSSYLLTCCGNAYFLRRCGPLSCRYDKYEAVLLVSVARIGIRVHQESRPTHIISARSIEYVRATQKPKSKHVMLGYIMSFYTFKWLTRWSCFTLRELCRLYHGSKSGQMVGYKAKTSLDSMKTHSQKKKIKASWKPSEEQNREGSWDGWHACQDIWDMLDCFFEVHLRRTTVCFFK